MADLLVDTNIVSYFIKRDTRAHLYVGHLRGHRWHLAFATVAELYQWAVRHNWGRPRIDRLRQDLRLYIVIQFDDVLAWQWAEVSSIPGRPMEPGDAWVAATALRHNVPLVTHNRQHFEHVPGIQIISEAP